MITQAFISYPTNSITTLILWACVGLAFLTLGGDKLCTGSVGVGLKLGLSRMTIGLTIVSAATSAPELVVSFYSAIKGNFDISLGNVIGSNLVNSGFILGVAALIYPIYIDNATIRKELPLLMLSTLVFAAICMSGYITRQAGILLMTGHITYVVYIVSKSRKGLSKKQARELTLGVCKKTPPLLTSLMWIAIGCLALALGAELLINTSSELARRMGVSELLIGLTIVSIGTSLPELSTSVIAALRKESEICVGNILGSNIFNILFVAGGVATIRPLPVNPELSILELPALVLLTIFIVYFIINDKKISRLEGVALMFFYLVIMFFSYLNQHI